jgi:hypothetical protein
MKVWNGIGKRRAYPAFAGMSADFAKWHKSPHFPQTFFFYWSLCKNKTKSCTWVQASFLLTE